MDDEKDIIPVPIVEDEVTKVKNDFPEAKEEDGDLLLPIATVSKYITKGKEPQLKIRIREGSSNMLRGVGLGDLFLDIQLVELRKSLSEVTEATLSKIITHVVEFLTEISVRSIFPENTKFEPTILTSCSYSDYRYQKRIGEGVYGHVYACYKKATVSGNESYRRPRFALKKPLTKCSTMPQEILREISIMTLLKDHPYVVDLVGLCMNMLDVSMVMSYHQTTLHDIRFKRNLSQLRRVMYQFGELCSFLEKQNVIHRDWKPANILWDEPTQTIRITDFGQSRLVTKQNYIWHKHTFTLDYRPPEVCLGVNKIDNRTDMWCIGLVIYFMIERSSLFDGSDDDGNREILAQIFEELGVPTKESWPEFRSTPNHKKYRDVIKKGSTEGSHTLYSVLLDADVDDHQWRECVDLVENLVVINPNERLTSKQYLAHPFFAITRDEFSKPMAEQHHQVRNMSEVKNYIHPQPVDVEVLKCTKEQSQIRSQVLTKVIKSYYAFLTRSTDILLSGAHVFDSFLRHINYSMLNGTEPTIEVTVACISSLLMVYKLTDDQYFDMNDGGSSQSGNSNDIECYVSSKDVTFSLQSSSSSDDPEENEEVEEEESSETSTDDDAAELNKVIAICAPTSSISDLKKVEHIILSTCGLEYMREISFPLLQEKALASGELNPDCFNMYQYLALSVICDDEVLITHTISEVCSFFFFFFFFFFGDDIKQ